MAVAVSVLPAPVPQRLHSEERRVKATMLPQKLFHAVDAMVYIAQNQAEAPVSSREIVAAYDFPPRYLEQILQSLVRADLLRGVRGPRGGYLLAREKRRISLLDIYRVIAETLQLDDKKAPCRGAASRTLQRLWKEAEQHFSDQMAKITLENLCHREEDGEQPSEVTAHYAI